jgi:hypothetical protein
MKQVKIITMKGMGEYEMSGLEELKTWDQR